MPATMLAIQAIWRSLKGATSSVGGKSADPPGVDFSLIVTDRLKRRRQRKINVGGLRPTRMHVCTTTHAPLPLYMHPSSRWCLSHAPCRLTAFNYLKLYTEPSPQGVYHLVALPQLGTLHPCSFSPVLSLPLTQSSLPQNLLSGLVLVSKHPFPYTILMTRVWYCQ